MFIGLGIARDTMATTTLGGSRVLVVEARRRLCAVPLVHVLEIMRPLPIEIISGAPSFVRGVSIIRGIPTPVVDLGALLGMSDDGSPVGISGRFVTLRLGQRQAAFFVEAVCGILELDTLTIQELPPLLQGTSDNLIQAITTLDAQMLVILRLGWQLPDAVWESLSGPESPQIPRGEIVTGEISESAS